MSSGDSELHVLAVDDSSVDRAVIARILCSSKYRGKNCFLLKMQRQCDLKYLIH
jgi:hypothetical protein